MKKFFRLVSMLAVAGLTFAYTSCTDYSEDINTLKEENSQLTSTIEQLEAKIKSGCVITGVKATDSGLEITTSDGKTYTITNGKDGKDGKDGVDGKDGKDGANGKDGVDGKDGKDGANGKDGVDGKDGKDGANGKDGVDGKDGKDGGYYMPNPEENCWYYYESEGAVGVAKPDLKVFPVGTITAEIKDGKLILHNVKGENGQYKDITLDIEKVISSLVFVPQCYVGGVEGMKYLAMTYNGLTAASKNSKEESWTPSDDAVYIAPEVIAEYHVNSNALVIDSTYTFSFIPKTVDYYTKADTDAESLSLGASFGGFDKEKNILKINVKVNGNPASAANKISVFALKAVKNDVSIVSDYATLFRNVVKSPVIAKADNESDTHFATEIGSVWTEDVTPKAECDTAVAFGSSIDLKAIVTAHNNNVTPCEELTADTLKVLGLDWKFELVENYKVDNVDQAGFVDLNDGVIAAKLYDKDGNISVGATPIVRVSLKHGDEVVKVAYIKVYIKAGDASEHTYELAPVDTANANVFGFTCKAGVAPLTTVAAEVKTTVYDALSLTKEQFHTLYNQFRAETKAGETVIENNEHAITWTIDADSLFKLDKGAKITHNCKYYNDKDTTVAVIVTLSATVGDLSAYKTYNVTKAECIKEYWNEDFSQVIYNVAVPETGSTDSTKCVFNVDINAAFTTVAKGQPNAGQIKLGNTDITGLTYFFCDDITSIHEVGGVPVDFTVNDAGTELSANDKVIATINNDASSAPWNVFEYKKGVEIAEKLLNTGVMKVFIGAKGYVCGKNGNNNKREIEITFQGQNHFTALVKRPVSLGEEPVGNFIDGVDKGETGSYIDVEDVINLVDWRGREFSENQNYWDYYGPFSVDFDLNTAKAYLNGKWDTVPNTIELGYEKNVSGTKFGRLTYYNNSIHVGSFKIEVIAKVTYGWGVVSQPILIEVRGTNE